MGADWRSAASDLRPSRYGLTAAGVLVGTVLALAVTGRKSGPCPGRARHGGAPPHLARQFKATHDRARMAGLFNVTLDANRGYGAESVVGNHRWRRLAS